MRGTFANIRIKNEMLRDENGNVVEGGYTLFGPDPASRPTIFDASHGLSAEAGTPLVIFGGIEYGAGSSRDWAAKGTEAPRRQAP